MKYFILPLGCQMNLSDSERIRTILESMGFKKTENEEDADLLGIISCSVRQKSIDRVYSKIKKWNDWKDSKNIITFVSGCILPSDEKKFLKLFDLLFRMNELKDLPELIEQYGINTPQGGIFQDQENFSQLEEFWDVKPHYTSSFEAFVPIQNGCDKFCSFCAVPYTRGREVSRPSGEILSEVIELTNKGYKVITLLGQNVNSYGKDKKGDEISFAKLLEEIGKMALSSNKIFWLYYTSPHPQDMELEVLEIMAKYPVLAKQIHLPLQSGDDRVLIRMNRNHNMDRYRTIIENIKMLLPDATLFTDIIVGFSGENKDQFEKTRLAMVEFQYNMAYIAQYSPRPGARSSLWSDDIEPKEKKRRLHVLTDILKESSLKYNQKLINRELPVIVEKFEEKTQYYSGRTEGKIMIRFKSSKDCPVGDFSLVKITSVQALSIEGIAV